MGVWAGVRDLTLRPRRSITTSMTLFSFSLLRPISSEAIAKAKLATAASWVASKLIPQKFMLWPFFDGARFAGDPAFCC